MLELSIFVHRDTISSLAKGITNNLLKGRGFAHMTHFCMHNCGVRKNSPRHSVNAINNVADDGLLIIAPTVLEATLRLWPKFHRFDLSLFLLQSWLYNI